MRADMFYQSEPCPSTVPLIVLSMQDWASQEAAINPQEKGFFKLAQFKGKLGDLCLITDATGALKKAYIGSGDNNSTAALAHAASSLPSGSYAPSGKLPHTALLYWALEQYQFDTYKPKKEQKSVRVLTVPEASLTSLLIDVSAVFLVRDLITMPANALGPEELGEVACTMAERWGAHYEAWVGDALLEANFPAIHMVGRASDRAPRLLRLTWGNANDPRLVLVGKGVCFDSGGLNIKPADGMRLMKKDMGGAAHALGLAEWIMANQLPVYLEVLIPAVDNVIGPSAFKPGDVITMRNGLTVEIDNTDAEGRLVLADALAFASETKADCILDFATLTGAARVAVGTDIAAMFSNDDALAEALEAEAKEVQDPIWRLPLYAPYAAMFESKIADMTNCAASSYAGAITAALFLQRFVSEDTPWVHFDIMAWNLRASPGKPAGGEAMGIRALGRYLRKKYA